MSTAEPFMPAHEPAAPVPPQEHDLDHDADVLFDTGDETAAPEGGGQPWHDADAAPTLPRPVAGAHLTAEELSADLATDADAAE
ncbi:hypothetical protein [Microbacterium sp. NPDC058389]|uniref:hypothetical protein n=1 Tax=Microbacterium sp. NPDC058389 TaxID=3346475 RepID=UPI0036589B99